jgi:hypothetical protein
MERLYVAWEKGRNSDTARALREGRVTLSANIYTGHC